MLWVWSVNRCPACGGPVQVWADSSGGVTVNFACDNAGCSNGKPPWDTPRPSSSPSTFPEGDIAAFAAKVEIAAGDQQAMWCEA